MTAEASKSPETPPPGVMSRPRVLLADDQPDVLTALRLLFKAAGMETEAVASAAAVLRALDGAVYDVLLMDLNYARDTTSGREGLDLLSRVQALPDPPAVVVMTGWGSVELAVEAMRRGARDFVEKPWDNERVLSVVRTQIELTRALRRGRRLEAELRLLGEQGRPMLVAESAAMQPVLRLVAQVGPSAAHVLVTGENGTGKGVVARALHATSSRAARPLVTLDAASLSETVFESELFGHVRGAFTDARSDRVGRVEVADGGTLFLDELGNVPPRLQGKLLRVVETGEFEPVGSSRTRRADVRIISATNADLHRMAAQGQFRQDLLFRLNTVEIRLPPLRERREDIPLLAAHFLAGHARRYQRPTRGFEPAALRAMAGYAWPGNVRELSHAVERAVLLAPGEEIRPADLALQRPAGAAERLEDLPLEAVERVLIQKALDRFGGNVSQAAKALGLSRTALYRRMEKHAPLRSAAHQ